MANARSQAGFTYFGVLFLVTLAGLALASFATVASFERQRERESELLFVGHQFREAIRLYYESSPGGAKRYPPNLQALLEDPRTPRARRHLRRIYDDPVTGKAEWGVMQAPGGGVMGVHSLSTQGPLKTAGFDAADEAFMGSRSYADWKFAHVPTKEDERSTNRSSGVRN
ncbi:MAG TPA: type II secretion system protein [Ramlibacter sp.]|uniref:type II secretion system protein n=1 Tax=Ramlibacter sp. TaxID=1917967 RepID=UPI002ED18A7F